MAKRNESIEEKLKRIQNGDYKYTESEVDYDKVYRKKDNKNTSNNFFEKNNIIKKSNNKYDDSLLNDIVTTGDTISNAFGNFSKGVFSAIEGTTDFLNDIGSQGWDIISNLTKNIKPVSDFAKKMSDTAENIRGVNYTNILTGGGNTAGVGDYANSDLAKNIYKSTNRNYQEENAGSVLGDTTQGVIEGVGQQLGQYAVSSALGVTNNTLVNNALIFSNSYGNAYSSALENGHNKEDARLKALSGGIAETISENIFDMNPLKLKTGGIGDSATNIIGNSFEKVFRNKTAGRIAVRALGGIGEGIEEPISNILDTAIYGTFKGKSGNEILQEIGDLNEENQQSFVQAMLSTWLVGGGNHLINKKQTNQVISEYAKDNKMSFKDAKQELNDNAKMINDVLQARNDRSNYNDMLDLEDTSKVIARQAWQGVDKSIKTLDEAKQIRAKVNNFSNKFAENFNDGSQGYKDLKNFGEKFIKVFNNEIVFDNNLDIDNNGISGYTDGDVIYVNPSADGNPFASILLHEMQHMYGSDKLSNIVVEQLKNEGVYDQYVEQLRNTPEYANLSEKEINDELASRELQTMLGNTEFLKSLKFSNPSLSNRFADMIKQVRTSITGTNTDKYLSKIENQLRTDLQKKENKLANTGDVRNMITGIKQIDSTLERTKKGLNNEKLKLTEKEKKILRQQIDNLEYLKNTYNNAVNESNKPNWDKEKTRRRTGWFKDKNGDWKFEFSDKDSWIKKTPTKNETYSLGDILAHNNLYKIDPSMQLTKVKFADIKPNGRYNVLTKTITINNKLINDLEKLRGTLLHEITHKIQAINGFEGGADSGLSMEDLMKYLDSIGEIEAADVKKRMNMSEKELRENTPESSKENPVHPNRDELISAREAKLNAEKDKTQDLDKIERNKDKNSVDDLLGINEEVDTTSFSYDNEGKKVNTKMRNYMKNSKARDSEGHLVRVYHTTKLPNYGGTGIQFNEFHPKGDAYYKFGDTEVNYFTDSYDMSGSYANSRYKMADGKRLKSLKDATKWLEDNRFATDYDRYDYEILSNEGKDNSKYKDMYGVKFWSWDSGNYLGTLTFNNLDDMLRNLQKRVNEEILLSNASAYQYEGYVNITNPYVVDAKKSSWNNIPTEIDSFTKRIYDGIKSDDVLTSRLNYLANKSIQEHDKNFGDAKALDYEMTRNKIYYLPSRLKEVINDCAMFGFDYDTYSKELNEFEKQQGNEGRQLPSGDNELRYYYVSEPTFALENDNETISEYVKRLTKLEQDHIKYGEFWSYFKQHAHEYLDDITVENITGDLSNITMRDLFEISLEDFNDETAYNLLAEQKETNDIVKDVIRKNKDGADYDGVIIRNVYDYGGESVGSRTPNDLFVTFNSNQFKSIDNDDPSLDDDWRYQVNVDSINMSMKDRIKQYQEESKLNNRFVGEKGLSPAQMKENAQKAREKKTKETAKHENLQFKDTKESSEIIQKQFDDVLDPFQISQLTKEDANTTPELKKTSKLPKGNKQSDFYESITEKTKLLSQEQKDLIKDNNDIKLYQDVTNKEELNDAMDRLLDGGKAETLRWMNKDVSTFDETDIAEGFILLKQYADNGQNDSMVEVAKKLRQVATKTAKSLQAFSILNRMTPEGMVMYAQRELDEAFEAFRKDKGEKWVRQQQDKFTLSSEEVDTIRDLMTVANNTTGYDQKVALAKIQKLISEKLPQNSSLGNKVKAWMRISMLFNPKTQVRNVVGNAMIVPFNEIGNVFATGIDKFISKYTGVRTTGLTDIKSKLKGYKEGAYQGLNDYKLGIDTRNTDKFEFGKGKAFSDKNIIGRNLNRVDHLLNMVMDVGDRVFYQANFEQSLANQMRLNNVTEPTQSMIDIATNEALSRTWNDNNAYTNAVLKIRSILNAGKEYGLGDILIPFAKTPANLTKAIVDYSPAGFISAIKQGMNLNKSIKNDTFTPQQQHAFAQQMGKATIGTMLYILGSALAKAGITTGEEDEDKDTKNFLKNTLGISSYSIKVGDKSFTYDWAQPLAAPLSITANIEQQKKNSKDADDLQSTFEAILSNVDTASSILLDQSFMQSINDVLNNNDGVVRGLIQETLELPARAIPTLSKQIADMIDPVQRDTFEYGKPLESAKNYAISKLPGLSKTLTAKQDTMGRDILKYGGKNNIFNVFLNPANVNTENISNSARTIYDLYKQTGDKTVMPRVAPYYLNDNGEKITFSSQERSQFQRISGKIIEEEISKLNNSSYKSLSNSEKVEVMSSIVNYSYNVALNKIKGKELSDTYKGYDRANKLGINLGDYITYKNKTSKMTADKDSDGESISGSKKAKVVNYVSNMNMDAIKKAILLKTSGYSFDEYDYDIVNYVSRLNISTDDKKEILKKLGYKINGNTIKW